MKTVVPKVDATQRKWYVVDADGEVLGRLASQVAMVELAAGSRLGCLAWSAIICFGDAMRCKQSHVLLTTWLK